MTDFASKVKDIIQAVPSLYRGPGGAVAVLKDGTLIAQNAWGYSNMENHTAFSVTTPFPICSISKQFVCALLTDLEMNPTPRMAGKDTDVPTQFQEELATQLGADFVEKNGLKIRHLANMMSGIRDYWALTVLWGAHPEGKFSMAEHFPLVLDKVSSLHFEPGSKFSYSNVNFVILGRVIPAVAGISWGELVKERVFGPAGMKTAYTEWDTALYDAKCTGYEGDAKTGYSPAVNRIEWCGDAGIMASLEDMIAYERYIDTSWTEQKGWYSRNAVQPEYNDGTPSVYGMGLGHGTLNGVRRVTHTGGLRGYRSQRLYAPDHRLSIVVLLNHEGDVGAVTNYVFQKVLDPPTPSFPVIEAAENWFGAWFDEGSKLFFTVARREAAGGTPAIDIDYFGVETLNLTDATHAKSRSTTASLEDGVLKLHRTDNQILHGKRLDTTAPAKNEQVAIAGDYHCAELDSTLRVEAQPDILYGYFDGFLGSGPMYPIRHIGENIYALASLRSMDAPPPGDWTLAVQRDADGTVKSIFVGCYLARKLLFVRK